ncbi:MAG: SDR family oxidoreductase, partial [Endomicrobiales bacterium]
PVNKVHVSENPVVLVTGASRGIGRALALEFARNACRVALHFHKDREKAGRVAEEIEKSGGQCAGLFAADVARAPEVKAMVEKLVEKEGRIDVLINNAGICRDRLVLKMPDEEWKEVVDVNLNGAFSVLRECARVMAGRRDGSIITLTSLGGQKGLFGASNYAASKAGVIALTKSAARELGRFNIRVNAVMPGFHLTDMGKNLPNGYVEKVKNESVLGLTTDIKELREFVFFLAKAKTVSGQVFNWDSRII